ncbi:GNAT family N-acetyltransferase [Variovorax sp. J22R133]|uniref:GNAT family N-acetyltransferase n=1 Tax=Variovorax brevis TaxID=3053503 RepID=UPI002577645F|nr:GNAT family N-acetyltransferase [Variovorax sp. J22R133]MDM0117931.1 GNAT family N-acetyltransferase [Variovorax sp. J22R133]
MAGAVAPALPAVVTLRDGRRATVREILPEDKDALQAAVSGMSAQARYTRFMATMREIPEKALDAATHPVPDKEFALVAVSGQAPDEAIVGGARYASEAGSDSCEFAIMIADAWQGQGLAPRLMEMLMAAAQAHGFRHMEGCVLSSNASMRGLARRLGFQDSQFPGDATTRLVKRSLGDGHAPAQG